MSNSFQDEQLREYETNLSLIQKLKLRNDDIQYNYIKSRTPEIKEEFLNKMSSYLDQEHFYNYDQFLKDCAEHITWGPVSDIVTHITKYETIVHCDYILYEWDNERILYVRISPGSSYYYKELSQINGFCLKSIVKELPFSFIKSSNKHSMLLVDTLEKSIELSDNYKKNMDKNVKIILEELDNKYHLIRMAFDCSSYNHYCIGEEVISNIIHALY